MTLFCVANIFFHRSGRLRFDFREESEGGLRLSRCLELEAFIDVLGDGRTVSGFEQVHIADSALGCLATAADVVLGSHALEVDVPAVELVLSHDELGGDSSLGKRFAVSRSIIYDGSCGLSGFLFCGFFSFLCHDFEVFGV